jgi:BUD22
MATENLSKPIQKKKRKNPLVSDPSKSTTTKKKLRLKDPEEQLEDERNDRYQKLVYQSTKALHKEVKIVKSFEVQKLVRRIKETTEASSSLLSERLTSLKQISIDSVVQIILHRLGIFNLNPQNEERNLNNTFGSKEQKEDIVEKMLQHKRLCNAMEEWNEKVTVYRRWYLRRKDAVSGIPSFVTSNQPIPSDKKRSTSSSSIFVSLGGTTAYTEGDEEEMENKFDAYGPASSLYEEVKKNRPGQRQRKAKAEAIEAKKEGRIVNKSRNWREKQKDDAVESEDKSAVMNHSKPQKMEAAKIADMGKAWKAEGNAHPSWAASASKKIGIVEFTGKKITFD